MPDCGIEDEEAVMTGMKAVFLYKQQC